MVNIQTFIHFLQLKQIYDVLSVAKKKHTDSCHVNKHLLHLIYLTAVKCFPKNVTTEQQVRLAAFRPQFFALTYNFMAPF